MAVVPRRGRGGELVGIAAVGLDAVSGLAGNLDGAKSTQ